MQAEIQYLHHSGFTVKTPNYFLVFDYDGIPPEFAPSPAEAKTVVFASHCHSDHYVPGILAWKEKNPDVEIILSYDIPSKAGCLSIRPDETLQFDGITVKALDSTDEGVAFLVEADGLTIYHAGDLNWWHWNGESDSYNTEMALKYRREIQKLAGVKIDLAFIPLDPRLDDAYLYGMDFFARTTRAEMIFPMHMWEKYGVIDKLKTDPKAAENAARVAKITAPGQTVTFRRQFQSNSRPDLR